MATKVSPRSALHGGKASPSSSGSPPQTRSKGRSGCSPLHSDGHEQNEKSQDEYSSGDDEAEEKQPIDEVDRCINTRLYPELSPLYTDQDGSLLHNRSPKASITSSRTQCVPRKGTSETRRSCKAEVPLTPEKGSPGRKIYPDLGPSEMIRKKRGLTPLLSIGFMGLLLLCCLTLYWSLQNVEDLSSTEPYVKSVDEVHQDIKKMLKILNNKFSQTKEFWVQVMGQLRTIMIDNPLQPAVILTVVPKGADATAVCLLHKISQAVSDGFEDARFVMYDVKSELAKGSEHLKNDLYSNLLRLRESHAAIVHNLELIPGSAAMTFHAFCDNENAPFKQALIILVVSVPEKYEDFSWKSLDVVIDNYLMKKWGEELPEKDVSAIVSRMANAPVLIKPESAHVLDTFCKIF